MLRNITICAIGFVCLGWPNQNVLGQATTEAIVLPKPTNKPATLTFEQLRNGVRQYYQKLRAIEGEDEQTTSVTSSDPDYARTVPKGVHHFAFKGEKRLRSQSFPPRGKPNGPCELELTIAFDGDACRKYRPPRKEGSIEKNKDGLADHDAYMQALAIPVSDKERSLVATTEVFLPFALDRTELAWKVSPTLETVDGVECHVLESKHRQRIWIDPSIGYAMRFRETYQQVEGRPTSQWPLGQRHMFGSYLQLADGVWLPQRIEIVAYTSSRLPENLWNRVNLRTIHNVRHLAINEQVADSLFKITFPPGTLVIDTIRSRTYRVGKSNEELDATVAESQNEIIPGATSHRRWWLILMNVVALVVLVVILIYRRMAKRRGAVH